MKGSAKSLENEVIREAVVPYLMAAKSWGKLATQIGCTREGLWQFMKGKKGLSFPAAVRIVNALMLDLGEIQKEILRRTKMLSAGRYRCTECKKELWEKGNVPGLAAIATKHFCDAECERKWREYMFREGSPYRAIAMASSPSSQREKN